MANPTLKGKSLSTVSTAASSLLPRRLMAWAAEVSLVAASAIVPYSLGAYLDAPPPAQRVPLDPVLAGWGEVTRQVLALPRPKDPPQVAPSTQVWWYVALAAPAAMAGWQLYLLGKTGGTLPKRWLGIRVLTPGGRPPGLARAVLREVVGKWGLPVGVAYGLWRYSPAFPHLGLLLGLVGAMAAAEGGMALGKDGRSLHDRLAGTVAVEARGGSRSRRNRRTGSPPAAVAVEVQPALLSPTSMVSIREVRYGGRSPQNRSGLWLWLRQHPGTTLLVLSLGGMGLVLTASVGTQVYLQSQAERRASQERKDEAFLSLADRLGEAAADPRQQRQSVLLSLARLEDPRAVSFLTDLLGQETSPAGMETLSQALASAGLRALPPLRQLNESLAAQRPAAPWEAQLLALRLRATQAAMARILALQVGELDGADLSRADLSREGGDDPGFALALPQADLAGLNFRGANLAGANFSGSFFVRRGKDGHFGTFDDAIADLREADLSQANFKGAKLAYVLLDGSKLVQATLTGANLSRASLSGANLSSAQSAGADFQQADLKGASLTGAKLGEAQFSGANLQGANWGQIRAAGANFSAANLSQSSGLGADLTAANLSRADLRQADLGSARLEGADLRQAQLQGANLARADLSRADLRGAQLAGANFQGVTLAVEPTARTEGFIKASPKARPGAEVQGVDFSQVKHLNASQLDFICDGGGYHPQCP